jgi:hypothetical protein
MFERPDFGRDAGDRPKRSGSAQIISRAIIGDQFGQQVFGHALVTVPSSFLFLCRLVGKSGCEPTIALSALCPDRSARMVWFTTGQHGPCNSCQLIGKCDDEHIFVRSALKSIHPCANGRLVSLDAIDRSPGTMHQDLAQVCVAAFADAQ